MVQVLRRSEFARILGVSVPTLDRLRAESDFPPARRISRQLVGWLETDIEQYIGSLPVADSGDDEVGDAADTDMGKAQDLALDTDTGKSPVSRTLTSRELRPRSTAFEPTADPGDDQ